MSSQINKLLKLKGDIEQEVYQASIDVEKELDRHLQLGIHLNNKYIMNGNEIIFNRHNKKTIFYAYTRAHLHENYIHTEEINGVIYKIEKIKNVKDAISIIFADKEFRMFRQNLNNTTNEDAKYKYIIDNKNVLKEVFDTQLPNNLLNLKNQSNSFNHKHIMNMHNSKYINKIKDDKKTR